MDIRVDKGSLLENYHFSEYLKNGIVPRFWRTKSGTEIDFVLEDYEEANPVEIKSRLKTTKHGISLSPSFKSFLKNYNPQKGFVYNEDRSYKQKNVFFLPHWVH